jgi:hypothetical protein
MLYKKHIIIWATNSRELKAAASGALAAARDSGNVYACGLANQSVPKPEDDPDWEPEVNEALGL